MPVWKKAIVIVVILGGVAYIAWPYLRHLPAVMAPTVVPPAPPPKLFKKKTPPPPPVEVKNTPTPLSTEAGFCYVGEWQNVRSCVEVAGGCESKQVFPTHELCQYPQLRP